jgi:hypothetical protein
MAGTVGAIFNGALQLGSAVGIAAVSSIETSIEERNGNPSGYTGRAAGYWFLLGLVGLEVVALLVFYRVEAEHRGPQEDVEAASHPAGTLEDKTTEAKKVEDSTPPTEPWVADGKIFSEKTEDIREERREVSDEMKPSEHSGGKVHQRETWEETQEEIRWVETHEEIRSEMREEHIAQE